METCPFNKDGELGEEGPCNKVQCLLNAVPAQDRASANLRTLSEELAGRQKYGEPIGEPTREFEGKLLLELTRVCSLVRGIYLCALDRNGITAEVEEDAAKVAEGEGAPKGE